MIPYLVTFLSAHFFNPHWILCQERETILAVNQGLDDTIDEPMAITSNYKQLVSQSRLFIDKSLLIKEILEDTSNVTLLVCPRKWGKTVNLDMIKTFLEIQTYENGKKMTDLEDTENYKLFKYGEIVLANGSQASLINRPLISKAKLIFKKYFGKYPVIFLDLSGLCKDSHDTFIDQFRTRIRQIYRPFRYILKQVSDEIEADSDENDQFATFDRSKFKRYLRRTSSEEELLHSVIFLSQVLKAYFKKEVFVLIDEYLTFLYEILLDTETEYSDGETSIKFYQDFLNVTLTNNPNMFKGILTGILRQNSETQFEDGFLRERCFFDDPIFNFYGFHSQEVNALGAHFSFQNKKMEKIHRWYGGFRGGSNSKLKIVNPWSVVHYINSRDFKLYWRHRRMIEPLIDKLLCIPSFDDAICSLITRNYYFIDEFRHLKYTLLDFEGINQMIQNFVENKDVSLLSNVDVVFKFLCMYGYLSLNNTYSEANQYSVALQVPNYEIRSSLIVQISNHHRDRLGLEITPDNLALFENLRVSFRKSTTDDRIICSQFEASVKNLLKIIPNFIRINRANALNETIIKSNENVMNSLFKFVLINGDPLFSFMVSDKPHDMLLVYRKHGIVLQLKPDVNGKMTTLEEKEAYCRFFRRRGMTSYKLIEVFVTYKNSVAIRASVFNEQMLQNT